MTTLTILRYPDGRLHRVAEPVTQVDDTIRRLVDDMFETMRQADGIGLAATQVNVHRRVIVMDVPEGAGIEQRGDGEAGATDGGDAGAAAPNPLVLVNPQITVRSDTTVMAEEGCLSVPDVYDKVRRHERVTVQALDRNGHAFTLDADGLLSVCIQHEIDHLDGKVFVEYLSSLKRDRIRTRMLKKGRDETRGGD